MGLCDLADELVEPLFSIKQDLAKTIYIHYASERDKNEQLQQENQQLKEEIIRLKELNDEKSKLALINHKNASQKEDKIIVLKDRIDKAIEYLGHCDCDQVCENITLYSKFLLEILKGDVHNGQDL